MIASNRSHARQAYVCRIVIHGLLKDKRSSSRMLPQLPAQQTGAELVGSSPDGLDSLRREPPADHVRHSTCEGNSFNCMGFALLVEHLDAFSHRAWADPFSSPK